MSNFDIKEVSKNKIFFDSLMNSVSRTLEGVKLARKSLKLNDQIDTSSQLPVDAAFWANLTQYGKSIGIDLIGFTEVDEYYIFEKEMMKYHVKDSVLDNAIVLAMEMKKEAINQAPDPPAGMEAMRIYAELGVATNKLAEYLRECGYQAQAFHPFGGPVLYPPMAEKAGLGEVGNNGILITREFGPSQRLSIITTDANPLPKTQPFKFRIREYCEKCGICTKKCPTGAIIPFDQKIRSTDGKYLQSIDSQKCFPQFFKTYGCSICIRVCPFYKVGYEKLLSKL